MPSFTLPPAGQLGNRLSPGRMAQLGQQQARQGMMRPPPSPPGGVSFYSQSPRGPVYANPAYPGPGGDRWGARPPAPAAPPQQNSPITAWGGGGSGGGLNFNINQLLGQLGSMGLGGLPGMGRLGSIFGGDGGAQQGGAQQSASGVSGVWPMQQTGQWAGYSPVTRGYDPSRPQVGADGGLTGQPPGTVSTAIGRSPNYPGMPTQTGMQFTGGPGFYELPGRNTNQMNSAVGLGPNAPQRTTFGMGGVSTGMQGAFPGMYGG